jgi:hypothetical protein
MKGGKHAHASPAHGGYTGPFGHVPRGTYHKYHKGHNAASAKVGVIRSPYKDTIVRRGGSAR